MKRRTPKTEYIMLAALRQMQPSGIYSFSCDSPVSPVSSEKAPVITIYKGSQAIGGFELLIYSDGKTVYFHSFGINEALRSKGLGYGIFRDIRAWLFTCGFRTIKLQVSRKNPAAFHLYKNSGLHVSEAV